MAIAIELPQSAARNQNLRASVRHVSGNMERYFNDPNGFNGKRVRNGQFAMWKEQTLGRIESWNLGRVL